MMQESALKADEDEEMRGALRAKASRPNGVIASLEGLITELRPGGARRARHRPAIEALVARSRARGARDRGDFDLAYEAGREPNRLTPELEATMYRIVQEALNNVIKHADARLGRGRAQRGRGEVTVSVEDDGQGLELARAARGFGLIGMRERVGLAGGRADRRFRSQGRARVTAGPSAVTREA